ncbi:MULTISPECIES: Wadjet anti-phage system protein JetD domain-containing protein [Larkinella]|uniref:DUF3322 and DUF2220 domain-containing protein n=1 Tax=Larkinella punicea TaxID=2315727 RepID=A0A368JUY3_9BACT|nr:Wadjet anti-phage system protein JetD domain-containing protein [Larkinella punicea]RCR71467.1 hypothetical protein DUE52_00590 [Larkinella punicea]
MITLAELTTKANRQYINLLKGHLTGENRFPLVISANKALDRRQGSEHIFAQQQELLLHSKNKTGRGYTLQLKQNSRTKQSEISRISFESLDDFLVFLGKEDEYTAFVQAVSQIRIEVPELLALLERMPRLVIEQLGKWPDLLRVVRYFQQNPQPRQYVRNLPIDLPTKFIETNRPILRILLDHLIPSHINADETDFYRRFHLEIEEPMVKIRFLDNTLRIQATLSHISVWLSEFRGLNLACERIYIIENLTSFLTFPAIPNSLAIWGGGFAVNLLGGIDWLSEKQLFYWGDIDVHGFQILSQIRGHYPEIQSMLMDETTFIRFHRSGIGGDFLALELTNLTEPERRLYERLLVNNWRVEQERLEGNWVLEQLLTVYPT